MTAATAPTAPTTGGVPTLAPLRQAVPRRSARCSCATSTVLRKNLKEFIPRTILQPLLLVFVFTYVFPKIGQGVGGGDAGGSAVLQRARRRSGRDGDHLSGHPGRRAPDSCRSSATPARSKTACSRRLPVGLVAFEKIVAGALQCLVAGLIVFPIAAVVPAHRCPPRPQLGGAAHARAARLHHERCARS